MVDLLRATLRSTFTSPFSKAGDKTIPAEPNLLFFPCDPVQRLHYHAHDSQDSAPATLAHHRQLIWKNETAKRFFEAKIIFASNESAFKKLITCSSL
jgi:hypothetical protein